MKKIQFIQNYRGVLTNEKFYIAGTVIKMADKKADKLVEDKRAKYVKEEK